MRFLKDEGKSTVNYGWLKKAVVYFNTFLSAVCLESLGKIMIKLSHYNQRCANPASPDVWANDMCSWRLIFLCSFYGTCFMSPFSGT
jgi:hypothetical protein